MQFLRSEFPEFGEFETVGNRKIADSPGVFARFGWIGFMEFPESNSDSHAFLQFLRSEFPEFGEFETAGNPEIADSPGVFARFGWIGFMEFPVWSVGLLGIRSWFEKDFRLI